MEQKKRKAGEENGTLSEDVPTTDDIAQLVESLSKEQLAGIVQQAALAHEDTLADLRMVADEGPSCRKIFVRGLSWTSKSDVLKRVFSKYGPVEEAVVINDKNTGKSKGFGFVTFKHRDACIRALKEPSKKIEGRMTVCHLSGAATSSNASTLTLPLPQMPSESVSSRKIYVGHVPKSAEGGALLEFFSQYGEIEEGPLGFDRETGKCKGFALFIYKSSDAARRCLEEPIKNFDGQQMQCKLAEANKGKEESLSLAASVLGYDITNPAAISSYNPSFLQSTTNPSFLQSNANPLFINTNSNPSILQPNTNPSLLQASTQGIGQSLLPSGSLSSYGLQGLDSLGVRSSAFLGMDSGYTPGSLSSMFGLGATSQSSLLQAPRSSSDLPSTQTNTMQGPGYPSLPRNFY